MQYDVSRAILTVSLFFAIFNAGKTCVYAFLTVFLRHLGISPFQAGLLRCLQTIIGGIVAPSILRCSGMCVQRRIAMITCIFLTMGIYLALLITSLPTNSCFSHTPALCDSFLMPGNLTSQTQQHLEVTPTPYLHPLTTEKHSITTSTTYLTTSSSETTTSITTSRINSQPATWMDNGEIDIDASPTETAYDNFNQQQLASSLRNRHKNIPMQPPFAVNPWHKNYPYAPRYLVRHKRSNDSGSIFDHLPTIGALKQATYIEKGLWPSSTSISCFCMLAVILLIGEIVCSPIDKLASSSWFSYLDEIDYTESHRRHLSYVPITTSVVVFAVGLLNLYYCYMTKGVSFNSYHLHFYIFGSLLGITLVTVSFFPLPYRASATRFSHLGRNALIYENCSSIFRYFCSSSMSFVLVLTVIVNGILYACVHDFVPWYIEDLGGSQFAVSCAVAIEFFSEAVGKFVVLQMRRRLSANGLVVLGVVTYGVRFSFFTVLYTSWGIVFTQLIHCFCNVLFWKGIVVLVKRNYDVKQETQILLALSSLHYVVGYSIGTILCGAIYNVYNPLILFWTLSGLSLLWGVILFSCFFTRSHKLKKRRIGIEDSIEVEQVSLFSVDSNTDDNEG